MARYYIAIIWLACAATCKGSNAKATESSRAEPIQIDCMDVLNSCCEDSGCLLLRQIQDLFQCVEILKKPPQEPPHCTSTCRRLIWNIIVTEYGRKLVNCSCSTLEEIQVPKISDLCQPFQKNALTKCYYTATSTPETLSTEAPTTEYHVSTQAATTVAVSTKGPTTAAFVAQEVTTKTASTRLPTTEQGIPTQAITTKTASTKVPSEEPDFSTQGTTTKTASAIEPTTETDVLTQAATNATLTDTLSTGPDISTQSTTTEAVSTKSPTAAATTKTTSKKVFTTEQQITTEAFFSGLTTLETSPDFADEKLINSSEKDPVSTNNSTAELVFFTAQAVTKDPAPTKVPTAGQTHATAQLASTEPAQNTEAQMKATITKPAPTKVPSAEPKHVTSQLATAESSSMRVSLAGPKHVTIQTTLAGPTPTGVPTTESKDVDATPKATAMKPAPTKIPSEAPKDVTTPAMSKEPKHVTAQLINTGPASIRVSLTGPKHVTIRETIAGPAPTGVPTAGEESKHVDAKTKATAVEPAPTKMVSEALKDVTTPAISAVEPAKTKVPLAGPKRVTAQLPNTRPASIRASLAGPKHVTIQATTAGPAPTGVPTTGEESKQVDTTTKATVIDPAPIKMLSEVPMDVATLAMSTGPEHVTAQLPNTGSKQVIIQTTIAGLVSTVVPTESKHVDATKKATAIESFPSKMSSEASKDVTTPATSTADPGTTKEMPTTAQASATATRQGDGSVVAAVVTSSMTSIDIDVSHDDVEGFAVKLQADQDTYEGFSNMTTTMAISGLSPDTLYRIDVTAVLHDGEERVTVLEIQTNQLENKTDTKPPRVIFGQEGVVILTDQTNVSSTTIYFSFEVTNNEATEIVVTWDEHHPGMGIPERVKAKVNANMDIRELSPHGPSRINVTASIADPDQSPVLYVLIIESGRESIDLLDNFTTTVESTTEAPTPKESTTETGVSVINATVTYITNIDVRIGKEGIKGFGVRWPRHQFAFKDFEINADVNVYGLSEDTTYLFSVTVLPSDRQEIASFIARTNSTNQDDEEEFANISKSPGVSVTIKPMTFSNNSFVFKLNIAIKDVNGPGFYITWQTDDESNVPESVDANLDMLGSSHSLDLPEKFDVIFFTDGGEETEQVKIEN